MLTLEDILADEVLDRAFAWLCHQRRHWPDATDVWDFRRRWRDEKRHLQAELRERRFRFGLLTRVTRGDGTEIDLWSARDAVVLKALAWLLGSHLPLSRRCTHLKGHGGSKAAVRAVHAALRANRFVLKTDVASYYDSIDHCRLLDRLARFVPDLGLLNLVGQYLQRTVERGGLYWQYAQGLSLGCPLSPIMGALFLRELDERFAASGLFYIRYMDDVVVLTPTRWKLRRAVALLNGIFTTLGLEKHPNKTFIGRVEKGFDFLGYCLWPDRLTVAQATVERFLARVTRLYEQEGDRRAAAVSLGLYVRRWAGWASAGVSPLGRPSRNAPQLFADAY